jgi:hypothetical protein
MPAGGKKKTSTKQARVTRITAFTGGQARPKTEAKPVTEAEARAEAKAEVKTEAKAGAKPGEAGPGETEPKHPSTAGGGQGGTGVSTIEVPGAVFEGVARELGTSVTIVKPLVEWVVNYLNRPCCWSVGIDRLIQDLARVRGEEVRFSLFVLGFEGGASKVTDEGFALLRRVLLVIIKYLRLAGFVEYIEDLGVVNYVRR